MRGFGLALSGLIGALLIHQPYLSLFFVFVLLFIIFKEGNKRFVLLLLVICLLFVFRAYAIERMNVSNLTGEETSLSGKIVSLPTIDGNYLSFQLQLHNETVQTQYRIKTKEEKSLLQALQPGMTCSLKGKLKEPKSKRNPGGFNYKEFLRQQNIHWLFTPQEFLHCVNQRLTIFDYMKQYRQKGLMKIEERFSHPSIGIVQALIFGEREEIDNDALAAYQILGLVHVLVVSGLHVGVILAFLFWSLIRLGLTREKATIGVLLFLPIYVLLTGAAPSVLRASIMAAFVLLAFLLKRNISPLCSISIAFLLLVFYNPYFIFHIGFQLSFIISFGLLLSSELLVKVFKHTVSRLIALSFIAQLISFPIILYHFYHLSVISFLVNAVFVPIFTMVILPMTFFSFFISLVVPSVAKPFLIIHDKVITIVHASLQFIENLPFASITLGQTNEIFICIYYAAIVFLLIHIERVKKVSLTSIRYALPLGFLFLFQFSLPYLSPYGHVTIIDVGQGDSILIEFPFRKAVYLIDAGGLVSFGNEEDWQVQKNNFDVGRDIVVPVLNAKGIRTIDKAILTHGHYDHIGGFQAVSDNVKVKEMMYGKTDKLEEDEKQFLNEAHLKNLKITFVARGAKWTKAGYPFYILGPTGTESSKNDRSIVLSTQLGGLTWLFMGDAEQEAESNLLKYRSHLQADVLKVGHHGSKTSTSDELLQHVNPKVALISVGESNTYGHPHEEVITRLQENGIVVLRTDEHGSIEFKFTRNNGGFK